MEFPSSRTGPKQVYNSPCYKCGRGFRLGDKVWALDFFPAHVCEPCKVSSLQSGWNEYCYLPVSKGKRKDQYQRFYWKAENFVEVTIV